MKAGVLVSHILLLTVTLSLLFTIIPAAEYKVVNIEVNAEDNEGNAKIGFNRAWSELNN
jgi:hypothetical protein